MIKSILYFLFMITAYAAQAANENEIGKVYLLTSIITPPSLIRTKDYIEKDTERVFRNAFKDSGYKYIIKHKTSQVELQKILTANDTRAVFWVSHANRQEDASSFGVLKSASNITDINGLNAKHIFQQLNPNIKFLGIIGCRANEIFKDFSYEDNKDLKIFSFSEKTTAKKGLIKAINASIDSLGDGSPDQKDRVFPNVIANPNNLTVDSPICQNKKGVAIRVRRIIKKNESINAVKILLNKSILLGHFEHANATADSELIQETTIYLPGNIFKNKDDLLISVETMEPITKGLQNFGEIVFGDNNDWQLFTNKNGQAVGARNHIYFFIGNVDEINNSEKSLYNNFNCSNND